MTWVVVGLFCEGPTDRRFLPPVIYRTLLALLLERPDARVELQEEIVLYPERTNDECARAICRDRDHVDVFVVHADAARPQNDQAQERIIGPIRALAGERCGLAPARIVPLLPVREMEAWILADPDAIARAVGFRSWPDGVPLGWQPERAESVPDPKRTLDEAVRALSGGRRGRRSFGAGAFLDLIAAEADLGRLGRLASYQRFRAELRAALDLR